MQRIGHMFFIPILTLSLLCACQADEEMDTQEEEETTQEPAETEDQEKTETEEEAWALDTERFNETETVDGVETIQNPDNIHVLVNHDYALPTDYEPDDLVDPDVRFSFDEDVEQRYLREPAADALEDLFAAASEDGQELFAVSGYRSYDRQEAVFANAAAESSEEEANETIATPGNSEHQTGLAMDVSSESNHFELSTDFAETDEGQWLEDHAHEHGFIIRYPEDAEEITEISYEPWHIRYVGEEVAEVIDENDITLEEFFEEAEKI
ncbi:M15 family metallopeptidase [Natribacillus halophilus]|uniref:D-Ala-D-Ala carboxypeptidase. Metallo peptidase. MEROPS family M15B n=1 Tax=Natribacillus halophilus TaxID=549003 RepID=A0A1G8NMD8_9BACI|nr:M15 family metallopeptidase [Natribacillus halophilus]SDI81156.1 D-Ala-D-Ala carboxypeptidase. Metallo peptidase. MEROPS family M15B [Natribacillus halophilus]